MEVSAGSAHGTNGPFNFQPTTGFDSNDESFDKVSYNLNANLGL